MHGCRGRTVSVGGVARQYHRARLCGRAAAEPGLTRRSQAGVLVEGPGAADGPGAGCSGLPPAGTVARERLAIGAQAAGVCSSSACSPDRPPWGRACLDGGWGASEEAVKSALPLREFLCRFSIVLRGARGSRFLPELLLWTATDPFVLDGRTYGVQERDYKSFEHTH